jgi:hypothetical protein
VQGETRKAQEGQGTQEHEARAMGSGLTVCADAPIPATQPRTTCDIGCDGVSAIGRLSAQSRKPYIGSGRGQYRSKRTVHPQDSITVSREWTPLLPN